MTELVNAEREHMNAMQEIDEKNKDIKARRVGYLLKGGTSCPWCGSMDIESGPLDSDMDAAWAEVTCNDCKKRWRDVFKLHDMEEIL